MINYMKWLALCAALIPWIVFTIQRGSHFASPTFVLRSPDYSPPDDQGDLWGRTDPDIRTKVQQFEWNIRADVPESEPYAEIPITSRLFSELISGDAISQSWEISPELIYLLQIDSETKTLINKRLSDLRIKLADEKQNTKTIIPAVANQFPMVAFGSIARDLYSSIFDTLSGLPIQPEVLKALGEEFYSSHVLQEMATGYTFQLGDNQGQLFLNINRAKDGDLQNLDAMTMTRISSVSALDQFLASAAFRKRYNLNITARDLTGD